MFDHTPQHGKTRVSPASAVSSTRKRMANSETTSDQIQTYLATATGSLQRKSIANEPGDHYEQQADRISEQVMGMSDTDARVQRKCANCGTEEELHRKESSDSTPSTAPNAVNDVIGQSGSPMDSGDRNFMESRFGSDFSDVRVHTDSGAAASASAVNARAYTVGNNIVFGEGQYSPGTSHGRSLLAHELVHTLQQGGGVSRKSYDGPLRRMLSTASRTLQRQPATKVEPPFGTWTMTQKNTDGTSTTAYNSEVEIYFEPDTKKVSCDEIAFVQNFKVTDSGTKKSVDPRENFKNRKTADEWTIDRMENKKHGWYGVNNDGTSQSNLTPWVSSDPTKKAYLYDQPGSSIADTKWEFESCAICKKGTEADTVYGCKTWGFDVDSSYKLTSHTSTETDKQSSEFTAAVEEWNKQAEMTDDSKKNDPDQQKLPTFK